MLEGMDRIELNCLIVDCVVIAPKGIIGLVKDRASQGSTVADPAVFALLYAINVIPLYFLHQEALSARPLEIIFWGILAAPFLTDFIAPEIVSGWRGNKITCQWSAGRRRERNSVNWISRVPPA